MAEKTALIFLILVGIQGSMAVIHSLKYFYTASSGIENFPSYVSVGFVDDVQISYCDSRTNENVPKQEWMNEVSSEHPGYWKEETQTCLAKQEIVKANLEIAKQRFNQIEGVHVFQQMYGCEWDNETGEVKGYDQFGYDGEDLITLDSKRHQWIAPKPQADITKVKWEYYTDHENVYLTGICVEWLKIYVNHGKNVLMRTVLPSISLLQRFSSSPVSCLATGFYPNRAEMFWRKDGEEIHDGVGKGEILPNNDETFQMRIYLDLSFVPPVHWTKYECVFQLSGVKEDLVTRLEKTKILTSKDKLTVLLIVFVSVINFGLIAVIGFILFKRNILFKRKTGCKPASGSSFVCQTFTENDGTARVKLWNSKVTSDLQTKSDFGSSLGKEKRRRSDPIKLE